MIDIGWVVHFRELDSQGGYWKMTPKGPYPTLKRAKRAKFTLENPISPFSGKRHGTDRIRSVKIKLRVEIG